MADYDDFHSILMEDYDGTHYLKRIISPKPGLWNKIKIFFFELRFRKSKKKIEDMLKTEIPSHFEQETKKIRQELKRRNKVEEEFLAGERKKYIYDREFEKLRNKCSRS